MPELNFDRLHQFFCKVKKCTASPCRRLWFRRLSMHGGLKFQIDVEHPLAWQTVQELANVPNYISRDERLPTQFLPFHRHRI